MAAAGETSWQSSRPNRTPTGPTGQRASFSSKSHELRTPLNAILGFGQLLQLDDLTQEQTESVDHILRGGRHLLELINEVLDISRIVSGNLSLSLSPEPVDALEVVRDPGRP